MKRITLLIATVLFAVNLGACQGSGDSEKQANQSRQQQSENQQKEDKATIHLNKETFKQKVVDFENEERWNFKGNKPCVVDFYADWCAPCRITSPILEELAREYRDKINVYKVDVDKHRELAAAFGVRGIPSFLYCPVEGKPTMSSGIGESKEATRKMFRQNIKKYLLNNK